MTVEELIEMLKEQPQTAHVRLVGVVHFAFDEWDEKGPGAASFDKSPDRIDYSGGEVRVICE